MIQQINWDNIEVSSKILGHISSGIYRSTGGALKELVSNAFDANATKVTITTNHPSFDIITCRDNGDGMRPDDFQQLMKGGIGDSPKRVGDKETTRELNRPIIGWLGIGMFGIAQVCHEFTITSHHRESKTAFRAHVKLSDFLREEVQETDPKEVWKEGLEVGKFAIEEIPFHENDAGTYIVASDMRSAFIRKFREEPGPPLPLKFSSFLTSIHETNKLAEMGDYWQMIWELSVACPIPYFRNSPFDWGKIKHTKKCRKIIESISQSLDKYDFEVLVDGLKLQKPNLYPYPTITYDGSEVRGELFEIDRKEIVYDRHLKLKGYIYLQNGRAIEPRELRGLLIRIRNVAIGNYDPTLLSYPKIEGPRFNWLSGEIHVEEGLETALNIDRDSFNEMHPHYVKTQSIVHELLASVFSHASQGVKERSEARANRARVERLNELQNLVQKELGKDYTVELIDGEEDDNPISLDENLQTLVINIKSFLWPRARNKREQAQFAAAAFEIALRYPETEQRAQFYRLLSEMLS